MGKHILGMVFIHRFELLTAVAFSDCINRDILAHHSSSLSLSRIIFSLDDYGSNVDTEVTPTKQASPNSVDAVVTEQEWKVTRLLAAPRDEMSATAAGWHEAFLVEALTLHMQQGCGGG